MTIVVFGSINVDITAYSRRLPRPGETVHGDRYLTGLGGKGANQASAAARLGSPTVMLGRVGSDSFAVTALDELASHEVETRHIQRAAGAATGIAIIGVEETGENCVTVVGGANLQMAPDDAEKARDLLRQARVLLLQNEIPLAATIAAAAITHSAGGTVIFDPAPAPSAALPPTLLAHVDILTPNESETEALTGIRPTDAESAAKAAAALIAAGAKSAIVKMGASGLHLEAPGIREFMPAFRVITVDTVAAGDCFNGGLAHALATGADLRAATRFAAACGALSTTRQGAAQSAPSLTDVQAFLKGDMK